jgi:pimeloyl-ACP methyl ester carboxylesterase
MSMRAGSGPPLVIFHHSTGSAGWIPLYDRLAADFEVTVPDLPGYGQSTMPEWAREPRDLAILMLQWLRAQELGDVTLVGLGFGGWVAAELATMDHTLLASLTLVGAPGLLPEAGEYLDQMLIDYPEYARASFRDEATANAHLGEEIDPNLSTLWQFNRVMTARISWKPYMYNRRLAPLLAGVHTAALIVRGSEDRVIPASVAHQYMRALPAAECITVEGAGHLVELEEPERVADLIRARTRQRA